MKKSLWGLILLSICIALIVGYMVMSNYAQRLLTEIAETLWGSPVEIESVYLSYFPFKFVLQNVQVVDPKNPSKNLFEVEKVIANVQLQPLLQRRLIIDSLEAQNVLLSTAHHGPKLKAHAAGSTENNLELVKKNLEDVDLTDLNTFFDLTPVLKRANQIRNERLVAYRKTLEFDRNRLKREIAEKKIAERVSAIEADINTPQRFRLEDQYDLEQFPKVLSSIQTALAEIEHLKKDIPELKENVNLTALNLQHEFRAVGTIESEYKQLSPQLPQSKARLENVTEAVLKDRIFASLKTVLADFKHINSKLDFNKTSKSGFTLVWVKSITLSGDNTKELRLSGLISHFSTHQSLIQLPTVATLELFYPDGNKVSIDLLADVRDGNNKAQFLAKFEDFKLSEFPILMGEPPLLLSTGAFDGQLIFGSQGEAVDGYFYLTGSDLSIPQPSSSEIGIDVLLGQSLSKMDDIKIEGTFSGTTDAPELHLASTLDDELGNLTALLAAEKDELLRQELKETLKAEHQEIKLSVEKDLQEFQTLLPSEITSEALRRINELEDTLTTLKSNLMHQAASLQAMIDQSKRQQLSQEKLESEKADVRSPEEI